MRLYFVLLFLDFAVLLIVKFSIKCASYLKSKRDNPFKKFGASCDVHDYDTFCSEFPLPELNMDQWVPRIYTVEDLVGARIHYSVVRSVKADRIIWEIGGKKEYTDKSSDTWSLLITTKSYVMMAHPIGNAAVLFIVINPRSKIDLPAARMHSVLESLVSPIQCGRYADAITSSLEGIARGLQQMEYNIDQQDIFQNLGCFHYVYFLFFISFCTAVLACIIALDFPFLHALGNRFCSICAYFGYRFETVGNTTDMDRILKSPPCLYAYTSLRPVNMGSANDQQKHEQQVAAKSPGVAIARNCSEIPKCPICWDAMYSFPSFDSKSPNKHVDGENFRGEQSIPSGSNEPVQSDSHPGKEEAEEEEEEEDTEEEDTEEIFSRVCLLGPSAVTQSTRTTVYLGSRRGGAGDDGDGDSNEEEEKEDDNDDDTLVSSDRIDARHCTGPEEELSSPAVQRPCAHPSSVPPPDMPLPESPPSTQQLVPLDCKAASLVGCGHTFCRHCIQHYVSLQLQRKHVAMGSSFQNALHYAFQCSAFLPCCPICRRSIIVDSQGNGQQQQQHQQQEDLQQQQH